jgi:hypothetical protein
MWRLPWTGSYSYPSVTAIRIDVHPARKAWYTQHVCFLCHSTYATCMLPTVNPRTWQPFTLTQQSWTDSLLPTKVLPTPPLSPTKWLAGPASVSLPNTTIKAVCLNQTSVDEHATRLTQLISPSCDQYVQYLLTGANPSILNRHR